MYLKILGVVCGLKFNCFLNLVFDKNDKPTKYVYVNYLILELICKVNKPEIKFYQIVLAR